MMFRLEPEESTIRALLDGDAGILALSSMFHQCLLKSTDRSVDSKLSCEGRVSFGEFKTKTEKELVPVVPGSSSSSSSFEFTVKIEPSRR